MPIVASCGSLASFYKAMDILRSTSSLVRSDPLTVLLGLLLRGGQVPDLQAANGWQSMDLDAALYQAFGKEGRFAGSTAPDPFLDLFSGVKSPGSNDWRNAFGSQKGLGCFATTHELLDPNFRLADRDDCPHRMYDNQSGDYWCYLAPHQSPCKSVRQAVGEAPKLLQIDAAQTPYQYRLIRPKGADLWKLLTGNQTVPLLPTMTALYSGTPLLSQGRGVISEEEFYADLGLQPLTANAIFDADPARTENAELIRMTEPYLLSCLRRQLHDEGFTISFGDLINFHLSLKPRAFVILSGISGTGKSLLPRRYAQKVRSDAMGAQDNFQLVPVKPAWDDVSDLLGFYNSIHEGFEPGPIVPALEKSQRATDAHGTLPVFVLLDELNLARVEHYFADFLSVMESREYGSGSWSTDRIQVAGAQATNGNGLVNYVGVSQPAAPFMDSIPAEVGIPDNLFVIGTVNIDESTQSLSNKVLDRANTIEFEDVDLESGPPPTAPEDYEQADVHLLGHALWERNYRTFEAARNARPTLVDEVVERLGRLLGVMKVFRVHFGLRTRDEVAVYMTYAQDLIEQAEQGDVDLEGFTKEDAFDRQVMQKVLPRIAGTKEELQFTDKGNLFDQLIQELKPWNCERSIEKCRGMRDQEIVSYWEA